MTDDTHVAVVGAGAVGASAAAHLADAGADVTLLDKGYVAGETTGKAAGLVYRQFHEPADVRAMDYCMDFFDDLAADHSEFAVHRTGYLRIGTEVERPIFEREVEMQRENGADVSLVGPEEIAEIEPALDLDGITVGTYGPDDGHVDPHTLAVALLDRAEAAGVSYRPKTAVTDVVVSDGRVEGVETEAGSVEADAVVIAAGPWSKRLAALAGVELPMKPYRVQALVTTEVDFSVMPVYDADAGAYFRSESGGVLVGDGTEETESDPDGYDGVADFEFLAYAGEVAQRRLPVGDVEVLNAWTGLSTATPDGFPLVGRPPVRPGESESIRGLLVATGLQGHGVMRAPIAGKLVADRIVSPDAPREFPEYDPGRFDAHPGDFAVSEMMQLPEDAPRATGGSAAGD